MTQSSTQSSTLLQYLARAPTPSSKLSMVQAGKELFVGRGARTGAGAGVGAGPVDLKLPNVHRQGSRSRLTRSMLSWHCTTWREYAGTGVDVCHLNKLLTYRLSYQPRTELISNCTFILTWEKVVSYISHLFDTLHHSKPPSTRRKRHRRTSA